MGKQEMIDSIDEQHTYCNEIRDSLNRIATPAQVGTGLKQHFEEVRLLNLLKNTLAFRNGIAHALYLSKLCTDKECLEIAEKYNIPRHLMIDTR